MAKRSLLLLGAFIAWCSLLEGLVCLNPDDFPTFGPLVAKESRKTLVSTESGLITAVDVHDWYGGFYHLQFITMEPSSLFLPVLLRTDMVFYVHTGRGTVSWVREDVKDGKDSTNHLDVERGDIYRIEEGSVFYIQTHPDPTREKLRIHAIFNTVNIENPLDSFVGAYSNLGDLVRGFDDQVLQMGFRVSEEVVQAIRWAEKPPSIVHFTPNQTDKPNWNAVVDTLLGRRIAIDLINGKKKSKKSKSKTKTKTFNVFKKSPDVKNCNGWSTAVTNRELKALSDSNIGVFIVDLTKGCMMGPHWNRKATEITIVIHGSGMVTIVCPSYPSGKDSNPFKCKNMRLRVKEGDLFIVPRFHPMAQMSFNNDSFVFMGFSTAATNNHPQYLAGKWSVLQVIDKEILAISLGASNTTIQKLLASQDQSIMLECTSCAEQAEKKMEEEMEREKKEEEARKREEEEATKREEEEAKKREEEEKAKKREEEEEAKRREEEAKREEEEEAKREEEAKKREEEEKAKKREKEEEAKRREEEAKREEEEKAKKREEEEEEEAKRREEEAKREEEEKAREEEEMEEQTRRREEEAAREREEEEGGEKGQEKKWKVQEEQEAARREEEERQKQIEEEAAKKKENEPQEEERSVWGEIVEGLAQSFYQRE